MSFLQSTTGWIFAVTEKFNIILVALEPIPPQKNPSTKDFELATRELETHFANKTVAFIAIGAHHASLLNQHGYFNMRVGKDPWVDLQNFEPTGSKGRGVRAARNQALRAGIIVEKWKISELILHPDLKKQVEQVHHRWKQKSLITMDGFLLKSDPWKAIEDRWCFIAKNKQNIWKTCG